MPVRVVEKFVYLGLSLHWKSNAEVSWADREGTAQKAFGALAGKLYLVPFLPLKRLMQVVLAIVGGCYLYGAEIWAPFIPHLGSSPGSRISKRVLSWIMGFRHTKVDRCRGWIQARELDVDAESRAVRVIHEAIQNGGFLERAIRQLHRNFLKAGRTANQTWMGQVHRMARKVWPRFKLLRHPSLKLVGIPCNGSSSEVAKSYIADSWKIQWHARQTKRFRKPPTIEQQ